MAKATALTRSFAYGNHNLPDPGADRSPDEVRQFYAARFPELATATVSEELHGTTVRYEFKRMYGEKG